MKRGRSIGLGLVVLLSGPGLAAAQQQLSPRWEIPGLDFNRNGVWRARGRSVARARADMLWRRDYPSLNAALVRTAAPAATAVTGTLLVPAIFLRYKDSNLATLRDTAQYSAVLFGTAPSSLSPPRPYTVRTYYEQLSNGLFSMQGKVLGWAALDSNEVTYTGTPGSCFGNPFGTSNCNGIFSGVAIVDMQFGMAQALAKIESTGVDWGQFDNDGPDGIPNSIDDDGYVDMAIFVHPAQDGACGGTTNNHIWSHRYQFINPYVTTTPAHNGGFIRIRDYTFQSGVGGSTACDTSQIMAVGTAAHEAGHGLGLPDLYDLSFVTEGIGEWGIMGSGNYASPLSPARMEAWSLAELGWVNVAPLTAGGTYSLGAAPLSDSAFVIRPAGSNPRGEYFLVENREAAASDSALIRIHCARSNNPPGCGGGLLIWHVDSVIAADNGFRQDNQINSLPVHGLALEEADGLRQLWCDDSGCNRGDAGDPYPGTSGNQVFSFNSIPPAVMNSDNSFVGFAIDSIRQPVPNGAMTFRVRFGQLTVVAASDTSAQVQVDGVPVNVFRNLLDDGSTHNIAVADTQFSAGGRTRFVFQSWSDGQPISHSITGALAGGTYTATLARANRLDVVKSGAGTVAFNPVADSSGAFVAQGEPATLTATATAPSVFGRWQGDTTTTNSVVVLPMGRPYSVTAVFDPQLAITTSGALGAGIVGNAYTHALQASGGSGSYSWLLASGALPSGLVLTQSGQISGKPTASGTFVFTVRVTSGPQQAQLQDSITVTAPTLALADVLGRLLTGAGALGASDTLYLDFIGNHDGRYDVGDFLAWVRLTGATPVSVPAGRAAAVARKGGRQ
jgi:M6 family metalloprotease-like protein